MTYSYCPARDYVRDRTQETIECAEAEGPLETWSHLAQLGSAAVGGALWSYFGPPHDIHDDWKCSFSFYFDVEVRPQVRHADLKRPALLLLRLDDWKGSPRMSLAVPRRPQQPWVIEERDDVLPRRVRAEVLAFFVGFLQGYISTGPLHDFARRFPSCAPTQGIYGVRAGATFETLESGSEECGGEFS